MGDLARREYYRRLARVEEEAEWRRKDLAGMKIWSRQEDFETMKRADAREVVSSPSSKRVLRKLLEGESGSCG